MSGRRDRQTSGDSQVTLKLSKLRDEAVRRQRNAQRAYELSTGSSSASSSFTFNDHSLPVSLDVQLLLASAGPRAAPLSRKPKRGLGYAAPPSWDSNEHSRNSRKRDETSAQTSTDSERHHALAFNWSQTSLPIPPNWTKASSPSFPTLLDVSVRALFKSPPQLCAVLSILPPHIQLRCSRYAAVFHPEAFYDSWKAEMDDFLGGSTKDPTFFDIVAGAEGEILYVGNGKTAAPVRRHLESLDKSMEHRTEVDSWDDALGAASSIRDLGNVIVPLTSLHLMNIPSTALQHLIPLLPPTLTNVSLLSLTPPITSASFRAPREYWLRALAKRAPWLRTLDLSFNSRLGVDITDQLSHLDWGTTWRELSVLGLQRVNTAQSNVFDTPMPQNERLARNGYPYRVLWLDRSRDDGDGPAGPSVDDAVSPPGVAVGEIQRIVNEIMRPSAHHGFASDAIRTLWVKVNEARVGLSLIRIAY